jgi:hypothetical protein
MLVDQTTSCVMSTSRQSCPFAGTNFFLCRISVSRLSASARLYFFSLGWGLMCKGPLVHLNNLRVLFVTNEKGGRRALVSCC